VGDVEDRYLAKGFSDVLCSKEPFSFFSQPRHPSAADLIDFRRAGIPDGLTFPTRYFWFQVAAPWPSLAGPVKSGIQHLH
jgi:hypothetical protein